MTQPKTAMHQPTDDDTSSAPTPVDAIKTRVIAALAEARKARHHKDCHCRHFDGRWCNAADALWSRAADRELSKLQQEKPQ